MGGERARILISCQGSIQLVSALAVLRQDLLDWENAELYLIVSELFVTDEEANDFFNSIVHLAESVCSWKSISYCPDITQTNLSKSAIDLPGLDSPPHVDLLLVSTETHASNRALMQRFPHARVVCYGDGPSIYVPKYYFYLTREKRPSLKSDILGWCSAKFDRVLGKILSPISKGYFLFSGVYDSEPHFPYDRLDEEHYFAVLNEMAKSEFVTQLRAVQNLKQKPVSCILLTSNFSEGRKIDEAEEIYAYLDFVFDQKLPPNTNFLVKPHPRDRVSKIQGLQKRLNDHFDEVDALLGDEIKYLPLEVCLIAAGISPDSNLRCLTVSSAGLSLKKVFDCEVVLGFGDHIVHSRFPSHEATVRIKHESDLKRVFKFD